MKYVTSQDRTKMLKRTHVNATGMETLPVLINTAPSLGHANTRGLLSPNALENLAKTTDSSISRLSPQRLALLSRNSNRKWSPVQAWSVSGKRVKDDQLSTWVLMFWTNLAGLRDLFKTSVMYHTHVSYSFSQENEYDTCQTTDYKLSLRLWPGCPANLRQSETIDSTCF